MDKIKKACIVIPVYQKEISLYEQISMDQCFRILGQYDIIFAVPEHLAETISSNIYCSSGRAVYKTFKDDFFADIPGYNRLMKSVDFYKSFLGYEYLLIYQLDAFVFKDELLKWCAMGFDNIGAPLFEGHEHAKPNSRITGQGNGGFCLRNVHTCYRVVSSMRKLNYNKKYSDSGRSLLRNVFRYIKHNLIYSYSLYPFQPIMNEDLFWAEIIPLAFPEFKVPEPAFSAGFSFEVNPDVLFEMNDKALPFGCHAWWRYNLNFWKKHIQNFGYEL